MKLNPNDYKLQVDTIKRMYEMDNKSDVCQLISEIAVATGVPVLAVLMWVEKLYGESFELDAQALRLIEFYGYDKIEEIND